MKKNKITIEKRIGLRIKEIRLSKGFSQEELSKLSGLNRSYITSIESGNRNVSIVNIEKISHSLGLTIRAFFESELFNEHTTI